MKRNLARSRSIRGVQHLHPIRSSPTILSRFYSTDYNLSQEVNTFAKIFEKKYTELLDKKLKLVSNDSSLKKTPLFDDQFILTLKKNILDDYQKNRYYGYKEEDHEIIRYDISQKINNLMELKKEDFNRIDDRIKLLWILPYWFTSLKLSGLTFMSILSITNQLVGDPSAGFGIALVFLFTPVGLVASCFSLGIGFGIPTYITRRIVETTKWDYFNAEYLKKK